MPRTKTTKRRRLQEPDVSPCKYSARCEEKYVEDPSLEIGHDVVSVKVEQDVLPDLPVKAEQDVLTDLPLKVEHDVSYELPVKVEQDVLSDPPVKVEQDVRPDPPVKVEQDVLPDLPVKVEHDVLPDPPVKVELVDPPVKLEPVEKEDDFDETPDLVQSRITSQFSVDQNTLQFVASQLNFEDIEENLDAEKHFSCKLCDEVFSVLRGLKKHIQAFHVCNKCDYSGDRSKVIYHKMYRHKKGLDFKCDQCEYAAKNSEILKMHNHKLHQEKKHAI